MKTTLFLFAAALSVACSPPPPATTTPPVILRPLEKLAGEEIVVLPVQYLSSSDTLGWYAQIRDRSALLAQLDQQIEAALTARGLGQTWTFGPEIARASKVNSIVMRDARSLSAEWLRGRIEASDDPMREPLATQLRGLVGLKGQRYAVLPVELHLENSAGMGVAKLRVLMIDARMTHIKWVGEVQSVPMKTLSPALITSVATHFADLVVAP